MIRLTYTRFSCNDNLISGLTVSVLCSCNSFWSPSTFKIGARGVRVALSGRKRHRGTCGRGALEENAAALRNKREAMMSNFPCAPYDILLQRSIQRVCDECTVSRVSLNDTLIVAPAVRASRAASLDSAVGLAVVTDRQAVRLIAFV